MTPLCPERLLALCPERPVRRNMPVERLARDSQLFAECADVRLTLSHARHGKPQLRGRHLRLTAPDASARAEFERALIRERTRAGLKAAKRTWGGWAADRPSWTILTWRERCSPIPTSQSPTASAFRPRRSIDIYLPQGPPITMLTPMEVSLTKQHLNT